MAPLVALINPLSAPDGLSATVTWAVVGAVGLALLAGAGTFWMRWRRRLAITELGQQRGLGEQTSDFLGRLFAGVGMDAAETMLAAPELLRARLARELRKRRRVESAQAYAELAARLLEELNTITQPFPDAPTPFMQLALQDAADPNSEIVTAWVLSVDERNISIISRHECVWPMRRELLATPPAGHGEPFRASLLLRPVPPRHEWVLTHDLVDVITNRRAAVRVSCCLETNVLPDSGDTVLLRERLADQETVPADELRRLHGWAQRHKATVLDVSSDGCRVELEHEVALRDRFHVLFIAPDDRLAGMPLAEVVSLQRATRGRVTAGVRFIGMRLKERTRLAEFVRGVAASQAKDAQPAEPGSKPATETEASAKPEAGIALNVEANVDAGTEPQSGNPMGLESATQLTDLTDAASAESAEAAGMSQDEPLRDEPSLDEPRRHEPMAADPSHNARTSMIFPDPSDSSDSSASAAPSASSASEDDGDDDAIVTSDDDRRRAMERLGLLPPSQPQRQPAPPVQPASAAAPDAETDFDYTPRFVSPFALPPGRDNAPPIEPERRPPSLEPVDSERVELDGIEDSDGELDSED